MEIGIDQLASDWYRQVKVRGVTGTRVSDSSLMPTKCFPNAIAASIMIAEKAADLVPGSQAT
jgi:choline dehydrogenase